MDWKRIASAHAFAEVLPPALKLVSRVGILLFNPGTFQVHFNCTLA